MSHPPRPPAKRNTRDCRRADPGPTLPGTEPHPHPARSRAEQNARARMLDRPDTDIGTDQQRAAAALAAVQAAVSRANRRRYQQP